MQGGLRRANAQRRSARHANPCERYPPSRQLQQTGLVLRRASNDDSRLALLKQPGRIAGSGPWCSDLRADISGDRASPQRDGEPPDRDVVRRLQQALRSRVDDEPLELRLAVEIDARPAGDESVRPPRALRDGRCDMRAIVAAGEPRWFNQYDDVARRLKAHRHRALSVFEEPDHPHNRRGPDRLAIRLVV